MLVWLLLCLVVDSQTIAPLTGTIRPLSASPADTSGLSTSAISPNLARATLVSGGRPSFNSVTYDPLFTVNPASTQAYTVPVTPTPSPNIVQFTAEPFYANASTLFTFELQVDISYSQLTGRTLLFNSAGDLWVYFGATVNNTRVGGILAVDLGGPHNKLTSDVSLVWNTFATAANIPGTATFVRMYVFYAHRSLTNVPFLKIQMSTQAVCSADTVGVLVPALNLSALTTAAGAAKSVTQLMGGELALVLLSNSSGGGKFEAAYAWHPKLQRITSGFTTQFDYLLQGNPNGFAFVFQNNILQTTAVGGGGSNLGYASQGFSKAAAVEFDVYNDGSPTDLAGANKIELHTKYELENTASPTAEVTPNVVYTGPALASVGWNTVIISYAPTGVLSVWLNNTLQYQATILHTRVLANIGEAVLFGFTTSNGPSAYPNNVFIKNWRLWTTPLSGLQSTAANTTGTWNTPRANDVDSLADLVVTARDPCNRVITLNGLSSPFVVDTVMSPGTASYAYVVASGKYNIFYHHTLTGNYLLYVAFENQQILGSPFSIAVIADIVSQSSTFNVTSGLLPGPKVIASKAITLVITAKDRFGNLNYELVPPVNAFLANWATESPTPATVLTPPYYSATLTTVVGSEPIARGVFVTYGGNPLASSFSAVVIADAVDADKTQFDLPGGQFQSIIAGTISRLTITPYDRFRNRIFSNPGGAIFFSMNLLGYAPVGAIEPVIPWTANTTYATFPHWELTFLPQAAGRYTFFIQYNGTLEFNTGVSPVVVAGPIGGVSLSFVPVTAVASLQAGFTILTQDIYQNLRTDPSDKTLVVNLGGVNTTCGLTAVNTAGNGISGFGCSYQGSFSGRYGVLFTPSLQQNLTLSVYLNGVKLNNATALISVVSGPPDPTKSNITSATTPLIAGTSGNLVIALKDAQGNAVLGRAADIRNSLLLVQITGVSASSAVLTLNATTDNGLGVYTIPFSATLVGTLTFSVAISGNAQNIVSSGLIQSTVVPSAPDPSKFISTGAGLATQQVFNSTGLVDVALRDVYNNPILNINATSNFTFVLIPTTFPVVVIYRPGVSPEYGVQFINPTSVSGATTFNVRIFFKGILIKGGNLTINLVTDSTTNATCLGGTIAPSIAGAPLNVNISDKGAFNLYPLPVPVFSAEFALAGIKTASQTVNIPSPPTSNIWNAVFQSAPTVAGVYSFYVYSNGQPSTQCNPCSSCKLTVNPSIPSIGFTKIDALAYTGTVGVGFYVNITVSDQYNNLIPNPTSITLSSTTSTNFSALTLVAPGVLSTFATTFVATPWDMKAYFASTLIVSRTFVSLAGPPATGRIIEFAANGTTVGVAGIPYVPSSGFRGYCLVIQDVWNQTITRPDLNNVFTMTMKPNSGNYPVTLLSTLTAAFDGTPCYQLVFTPFGVNTGAGFTPTPFEIRYNGNVLVQYTTGYFLPGNVNVSNVRVIGLSDTYYAYEAFQFSVLLVDSYFNNITANEVLVGSISTLPSRGRIIGPLGRGFSSPVWSFTYPGAAGSLGELTYAGNWTIALTYQSVPLALTLPNGFPPVITVLPGPTHATSTVVSLPVINSSNVLNGTKGLIAGTVGTWSYALYDKFMNPVIGINNDVVTVSFLSGVRDFTICDKNNLEHPDGNLTISDVQVSFSAGQGTMVSTVARQVVMYLKVNGEYIYIGPCINVQEAFTVNPAVEDPLNTLISGSGLNGGVAGSYLSFVVVLRDRYNNSVDRGGALIKFGPNNMSTCVNPPSSVLTVTNQSLVVDLDNGTYTSTFQTTQAQRFLLLVSIDGNLAGAPEACRIVIVSPWYADSSTHTAQNLALQVRAGSPAIIKVQADDIFGNLVTNQAVYPGHRFLASLDRSLCPIYVKRTIFAANITSMNAGAPWIGWDSGAGATSGCVGGAGDPRTLAAQALRSAVNSGNCYDTCTDECLAIRNSSIGDLPLFAKASQTPIGNGARACAIFPDPSVTLYSLSYRADVTTNDCAVPPCWTNTLIFQDSQSAFFVPEYPGQYSGSFLLVPDPTCVGCVPRFLTTNVNFQVDAATCGQQFNSTVPYRCLDGSCKSSPTDCPEACSGATPNKCFDGSCSATQCGCPSGYVQCAGTMHCVETAALCPAADTKASVCPTGTTACWNGVCASTLGQCPSKNACPPSFVMCSDSQTCVRNASECVARVACAPGMFQCQNGYCVSEGESCPSVPSCSGSNVACPDGSCAASGSSCPDVSSCFEPIAFRCADGSCRAGLADCPTGVTCPLGLILCDNNLCMKSCPAALPPCMNGEVRCFDGTCKNNVGLCPTRTTCTSSKPVLCPDGSCVESVRLCAVPPSCNTTRCPTGFCATSAENCPTLVTCPFNAPVKCPDGQCQTNVSLCMTQPGCPYVSCPDGSCRREFSDCPSVSTCPPNFPIRCADGSCQSGAYMCPLSSCGSLYRCPGGACMETKSQCPTRTTCPPTFQRCIDGSCRSVCGDLTIVRCAKGMVTCPQAAYGVTCATDISKCPLAQTCPNDRPVRCLDATCVFAAKDCIATASVAAEKTACPDGGWASNGAENCYPGVTCPPWNPVKCWDNTCRQLAEDCPKQSPCPISLGGRYLCSDGTCARTLDLCASRGTRCADGMVKCPTGTCVSHPTLCPNSTNAVCPDQATLCMDGTCRRTPSIWCRPLLCPIPVPYLCDNGACAVDASKCPLKNGCSYDLPKRCPSDGRCIAADATCPTPNKCANGTFLCADGTGCSADCGCVPGVEGCTAPQENGCKTPGDIRCHDGLCKASYYCTGRTPAVTTDIDITPGFVGSNLCPMAKPFRCPNGLCAISNTRCPVYPVPIISPCPKTAPFLCANGLCMMSGSQCPVLVECPRQNGIKRCGNGYCDTSCPPINTCPVTQNFRCDNGMCVASADLCVDFQNNNCPTNQTICPDGHCRPSLASCPPAASTNGCDVGINKCADGSCQATCPKILRCPYTHTYVCAGVCSETPCVGGTMAANGCGVATPFRCADGQCKKYPARLGNQTSDRCSPSLVCDGLRPVLCGDGTCVALAKHCRPIICATKLCPDGSCSATCSKLATCPSAQPVLCPDGSCRFSAARCSGRNSCEKGHQCWDGSCKDSLMACAIQTSKLTSVPFTGAELVTTICPATGIVCPNGLCALAPEDCDVVPACPYEAPLRCWNGGCYATTCPPVVECGDKQHKRCEDGSCRTKCLDFDGCPLTKPFFCPGRPTLCVQDHAACDAQATVACSSGCNRDVAASKQSVTVLHNYDTTVEVGLQHNLPRLRLTFYSGAFADTAPALVDVVPARITHLPLSSRVLSTPFMIQSQSKLAMDVGVDADIDWKRFEASASAASVAESISCELQASYEITTSYVDALGARGTCTGEANITTNHVGIRMQASGTSCAAFEEQLVFTNQTVYTSWNEATQRSDSCLCTKTENQTSKCFRAQRNRAQVTLSTYTVSQPGCPSAQEVTAGTDVLSYNFNPVLNSVDACYLIVRAAFFADQDICLGVLSGDRFRCLETRSDRVERDWNSPFDQPGVRRIGRVSALGQVYAFVYSPLPPDAVEYIPAVTWWQQYGTATLASSITFGVVFLCIAVVLFNFNRFRQKYQVEKEHMDHLQDQVADLDQYAGGLGMTDEGGEFDMVANPMVIEIEALQKQVETVNDHLHGQAEEDAAEIDALELERQQLFAEIQRVKEAIATNEKGKAPKRVVEAPSGGYEAPAVVAAMAAPKTVRRADFGQVRATRKPKDIE